MPADPISDALREWDQVRVDAAIDYPFLTLAMERLRDLGDATKIVNEGRSTAGWIYWLSDVPVVDGGGDAG